MVLSDLISLGVMSLNPGDGQIYVVYLPTSDGCQALYMEWQIHIVGYIKAAATTHY